MRYRAVISYLGKGYAGWQRQRNQPTVQEELEKAFEKVFGKKVAAQASGRTDAGVHAEGQVVSFDAVTSIPADKIPYAVNCELPDDVAMLACEEADESFNAQFSAKKKTYRYQLYVAKHRLPLLDDTHEHIVARLDEDKMKEGAKYIVGTHDFKCFEASGSEVLTTVRTVYDVKVEGRDLCGAREITVSVTGNGFLYNMVRIIAGTLCYVGMGKFAPEDVKRIIDSRDRTLAGKTMPPQGLVLESVEY